MFVYVLLSATTALLSARAENLYQQSKNRLAYSLYAITAMLYCCVAGVRDINVGVDYLVYGQHSYNAALLYDFNGYRAVSMFDSWGILYLAYSWFAARISNSPTVYLAILQAACVVPVLVSSHKILKENTWIAVFTYGIVFFPASLNMMRQSIAMGFVLFAYTFALDKKLFKYLLLILIAIGFHQSAVIALPAYLIIAGSHKASAVHYLLLVILLSMLFLSYDIIIKPILSNNEYSEYITGDHSKIRGGTHPNMVLTALLILGWVYSCWLKIDFDSKTKSLFALVLVGIAGMWLSFYSYYLYRLGYYYLCALIPMVGLLLQKQADKRVRMSLIIVLIGILMVFFLDYYVIVGSHNVVPYAINLHK